MARLTTLLGAILAAAFAADLVAAAPSSSTHVSSLLKRASVCNAHAELCDRLYSNVTYIGAHDSYAIGDLQNAVTGHNQEQSLTTQLNDGIRLLQIQAHKNATVTSGSGIELCHTSCDIQDGGSLEDYLSTVKSWVDSNPNDVITILIVNYDDQPVSSFAKAFSSTGLASNVYTPQNAATAKTFWPTLGSMIDSGKTVVVQIDNSADTTSVPYILPHFSNVWENPYNQISVPFNCSVDRINQGSSPNNLMYLINHFLDNSFNLFGTNVLVPNIEQIATTNSYNSIMQDSNDCALMHGSWPTYVLTDFYDQGNGSVFQAAATMNGVQYIAKPIGNATTGGGLANSGSSSGSGKSSDSSSSASSLSASGLAMALVATWTLVAALL